MAGGIEGGVLRVGPASRSGSFGRDHGGLEYHRERETPPGAPIMDRRTQGQLREINRRFYRERAEAFDESRDHPWPGWERVWAHVGGGATDAPLRVLDVGCGNGRFARFLAGRAAGPVVYTGIDESPPLLAAARDAASGRADLHAELVLADVLEDPEAALPAGPFDCIAVFGLLHHVPGRALREALVGALAARLAAGGHLVFTIWRFEDRERFASRIVPWSRAPEIDPGALEPGDHLMAFGDTSAPTRYCHHCDDDDLAALERAAGLDLRDRFDADGRSADLNRYVVLGRPPAV